jgi:hypothetical protein
MGDGQPGMAHLQAAGGREGAQICRTDANILNKQQRQPITGGPPVWRLCEGLPPPRSQNKSCYQLLYMASKKGQFYFALAWEMWQQLLGPFGP